MVYIGIDPGVSGGIAVILPDEIRVSKMPTTEADLLALLEPYGFDCLSCARPTVASLERVWAGPRMGSSSAFKFGAGVGRLRMVLTALRIPFSEVLPKDWQDVMRCRARGKGFGERNDSKAKNITKRRAQKLFPRLTITHWNADALLIAEYCRLVHGGRDGKEEGWKVVGEGKAENRRPFEGFNPEGVTRRRKLRA